VKLGMNGYVGSEYKTIVIIPTYNERENIYELVGRLEGARKVEKFDVLFIDDNSPDGTHELIRELINERDWIQLRVRMGERGLGTALKRGYLDALMAGYDYAIQMDGDLQHPPEVIPSIINKLRKGYDVVIASRYIENGGIEGWSFYRRMVSKIANMYAKFILGLSPRDVTSGFRGFSKKALEILNQYEFRSRGYALQVEALYILEKKGLKISEVPFTFTRRKGGASKLGSKEIREYIKNLFMLRFYGGH